MRIVEQFLATLQGNINAVTCLNGPAFIFYPDRNWMKKKIRHLGTDMSDRSMKY